MEREAIRNEAANSLKLLDMQLVTDNMDEHMLRYEALQLAKKCYGGKYIASTNITSFDKNDPSGTVLASVLNKIDATKGALGIAR